MSRLRLRRAHSARRAADRQGLEHVRRSATVMTHVPRQMIPDNPFRDTDEPAVFWCVPTCKRARAGKEQRLAVSVDMRQVPRAVHVPRDAAHATRKPPAGDAGRAAGTSHACRPARRPASELGCAGAVRSRRERSAVHHLSSSATRRPQKGPSGIARCAGRDAHAANSLSSRACGAQRTTRDRARAARRARPASSPAAGCSAERRTSTRHGPCAAVDALRQRAGRIRAFGSGAVP
jgi:hypothetical protein